MSLQIQKGASGARADDTKGMKAAIVDWITPKGQSLTPHIPRNVKSSRGFHHDRTGALLCPADLDWSNLAYVIFPHEVLLINTYIFQNPHQACKRRDSSGWRSVADLLVC